MSQYYYCISSVIRSCVIFVHMEAVKLKMIPGQSPVGDEGGAGDEQGQGGEK